MTVGMSSLTDHELIVCANRGDGRALADLLRRHDGPARGLAWRVIGDPDALDDVMQDAHLRVFGSLAGFDPDGPAAFRTWLCRIVLSCAIDHRRRTARRPISALTAEPRSAVNESEQADWRDALRRSLLRLDPDIAAAVALVDGEGMTQREAAELLGIDRDRLARRLGLGRRSMKSYLERHGVTLP